MYNFIVFATGCATGTILWVSRAKIWDWAKRTFTRNKASVVLDVKAAAAEAETKVGGI